MHLYLDITYIIPDESRLWIGHQIRSHFTSLKQLDETLLHLHTPLSPPSSAEITESDNTTSDADMASSAVGSAVGTAVGHPAHSEDQVAQT